jgi:hypothetical protein
VAEQERRKELLKSTRGLTGNGLKATMERMKALKASKAQARGTIADADTDDAPSSAAAPPAPAKAPAPPRAQPAGNVRGLGLEAYGGVVPQISAGTGSEEAPVGGGRVPSASSAMQDIGGAVTVEVCLCYVS